MPEIRAVDLFAGPGGWDVGASALGISPLGIEWDDAACATRAAAGLETRQADVSALDPAEFPCDLLIASPPCPTFSAAGHGRGHDVRDVLTAALDDVAARRYDRAARVEEAREILFPIAWEAERERARRRRREPDRPRAEAAARRDAEMSLLIVEPLRWALALRPRLTTWEQVPLGLPLFERAAELLRAAGYHAWAGVLSSEQFGVPQTRARAILLASLDGPVAPPRPTHQRYVSPPRELDHGTLFDPGPRGRIVAAGDEHLEPWVSMADGLGWGPDERAGFPRRNDLDDGGEYRERDFRDATEPAFNLTSKARSLWWLRNGNRENAAVRAADEPAPTLHFGHALNDVRFVQRERSGERAEEGFDPAEAPAQALTSKTRSWTVRNGQRSTLGDGEQVEYDRPVDAPAPTLTGKAGQQWTIERPAPTIVGGRRSKDGMIAGRQLPPGEGENVGGWGYERPAMTMQGDARVFHPGGHVANDGRDNDRMVGRSQDAVRISVPEASILQSFPPDYPWQGSRTKQFEQVGNCVPPLLAYHVLRALVGERP